VGQISDISSRVIITETALKHMKIMMTCLTMFTGENIKQGLNQLYNQ